MLLDESEIQAALAGTPWRQQGATIMRDVKCEDFAAAITLIGEVAQLAERADHHPDILLHGFNHLRLTLSTHSEGGVTEADVALSRQLDALLP